MANMYTMEQEQPADYAEVEFLYDSCFAPGREALSSYRLRDGVQPVAELCLVARDPDRILAGAIRYWPVCVGRDPSPILLLGPVAVHPTRQGEGLGQLLMQASLEKARDVGWDKVMLVGDEPYYRRFGFRKNKTLKFPPPTNPDRVLSLALVDGAFDGVKGEIRKFRG